MIDNDNDGERELVLGNRQLLGIFFVATLLCGVFFAMGYVVGGNSAKAGAAAADNAPAPLPDGKREEPQATQPSSSAGDMSARDVPAGTPGGSDTASTLPGAEPRVSDNPAASGTQPSSPVPISPTPVEPARSVASSKSLPVPQPSDTSIFLSVPEKGTSYWQVIATQRQNADALVQTLRERHLPAIVAESSNPKLFRVLVGPYRTTITMAEAKKKLTEIGGFDGLIPQRF